MTTEEARLGLPNDCTAEGTYACSRCGHSAIEHQRNPSCRVCRCNADPVCPECGDLCSKHPTLRPAAPSEGSG